MIKLPTVKINGQTAYVLNKTQVEDDVAVAEAICRDAERFRKLERIARRDEAYDLYGPEGCRWWLSFYDAKRHDSFGDAVDKLPESE